MDLEQLLIGISAQAAVLVEIERGTVITMPSVPKALSVVEITAEISGIRQNPMLTVAFQVTLSSMETVL